MEISKEEILRINKGFGGGLRSDSSIDFAIEKQEDKKLGEYKKLAYLMRAVIVDHPFTDGNFRIPEKKWNSESARKSLKQQDFRHKRTAMYFALKFAEENKKQVDRDLLLHHIVSIAKHNETSIINIERRLKNAVR